MWLPGFEPHSPAWKTEVLPTALSGISISSPPTSLHNTTEYYSVPDISLYKTTWNTTNKKNSNKQWKGHGQDSRIYQ
jgi:hypothetical protein